MFRGVSVVVVVVVASIAGVGIVSANERPLAAAGLDQEVSEGSVVYLDAGGSLDPDGSIEGYRWSITAPNGTTIRPDCPSCVQTQFLAGQDGTYNVTVSVTDDDGATQSDTLYVTATPAEPPAVTVSGPVSVENGTSATFEVSATAGDHNLDTLVWTTDGTETARQDVSGEQADKTVSLTFETAEQTQIQVRALDSIGAVRSDSHSVKVVSTESDNQTSKSQTTTGGPDAYESMLIRDDGSYEVLMPTGVVSGRGPGTMLDRKDIGILKHREGIEMTSVITNTGPTEALSITNPQLKDDIDKEAGSRGSGFLDSINEYINPDSSKYEVNTKRQLKDPGLNWERTGRVVTGTITTDTRSQKENYELVEVIEDPESQTYKASTPRNPHDRQIGVDREYTTHWQDTRPADGDYEATRQNIDYYTWTETQTKTERVKVGTEIVGQVPEYGWKEVQRTETKYICVERTTLHGNSICTRTKPRQIRTTERVWGIVGSKEITQPEYETRTHTEKVTKTGRNPPFGANATPHYSMEYKVRDLVNSTPIWQPVSTKYKYEIYTYEWERTDI